MKKSYFTLLSILFIFFSCNNEEEFSASNNNAIKEQEKSVNLAIPLDPNAKGLSGGYQFFVNVGHPASACQGCVLVNGIRCHVKCQGWGTDCLKQVTVTLSQLPNGEYQAVTTEEYELTTEDQFLIPDRSLYVGSNNGEETWLNISEQLISRNDTTAQFVFEGLYFTNDKVYDNQ